VALTSRNARAHAAAFCVLTLAALVADAALQLALSGVSVSRYGSGAPWWITAHVVERGRWVAFAVLLWWVAPWVVRPAADRTTLATPSPQSADTSDRERPDAWRHVGVSAITVPLLWVAATWMVSVVRFTLLGSWSTDGRVFVSSDYYRAILVDYAPWLMAGLSVLAARRHL
jgi:hypothetical protein